MSRLVIHLDECEPDGKGWASSAFGEATDQGAELCAATQYMASELYVDEPVWIETVAEKPKWTQLMELAYRMEEDARTARRTAALMRCQERESGGVQCTQDAEPADHGHRVKDGDLPS